MNHHHPLVHQSHNFVLDRKILFVDSNDRDIQRWPNSCEFEINCPQIYIALNGNVYNRHLHFIYWDENNKMWNKTLFTQPLICHVDKEFVEKHRRNALVIDALPEEMYNKKHIKGAINLPANKRWNEEEFKKLIHMKKMSIKNKQIPIIVYCYNLKCNAAIKVIHKLNKMGYYNIVHFEDGISSWKGDIEITK